MNLKKLLSGALIGAFVFGISAGSIQPVSAASSDTKRISDTKDRYDSAKDKHNSDRDKFNGSRNSDSNTPPEPPKDANGNPMAPPDKNSSNGNTPPEPPKDANGKPMAPPDERKLDGDGSVKYEPPSDRNSDNRSRTR
ncbi:MAG: hypothetical protein J5809_05950 [Selenomonadaceae bacterium]|nr:hypothetical protein [Selenomonadaceae bacterium]